MKEPCAITSIWMQNMSEECIFLCWGKNSKIKYDWFFRQKYRKIGTYPPLQTKCFNIFLNSLDIPQKRCYTCIIEFCKSLMASFRGNKSAELSMIYFRHDTFYPLPRGNCIGWYVSDNCVRRPYSFVRSFFLFSGLEKCYRRSKPWMKENIPCPKRKPCRILLSRSSVSTGCTNPCATTIIPRRTVWVKSSTTP